METGSEKWNEAPNVRTGPRPKVSAGTPGNKFRPFASPKATASAGRAVAAIPASHAALLKDTKVEVFGSANDVELNGEIGFTHAYDKSKNTVSVGEKFIAPGPSGWFGRPSRTLREYTVASVEHETMQALGAALDDKLGGAGYNAMADAFRSERPMTPAEKKAGMQYLGSNTHQAQRQMFSELYSVAYNPDNSYDKYFGSMTRARAAQVFAPEVAKIKKLGM